MPCYEPNAHDYYMSEQLSSKDRDIQRYKDKANKLEAMLCAVLTVLTKDQTLRHVLRNADWKEAGISQDEISSWWVRHQ